MICVTGASGTVSSEVIRQLESSKAPFSRRLFLEKKGGSRTRERDRGLHHRLQPA